MSSSPGGVGAAVQPHPQPQQRIGEAVALLPRHDQVDVLEPRQVVLGRARRAAQAQRDLGQRQRLFLGQHVEDGLERAVAAGAVQPQLVGDSGSADRAAPPGASSADSALTGSAPPRGPSVAAVRRSSARRPGARPRARAPAARARRARRLRLLVARTRRRRRRPAGSVARTSAALSGVTWQDLESRRRLAQQPLGPRRVARRQHEAVAARRRGRRSNRAAPSAGPGSSRRCAARGTRRAGT